MKNIGKIISLMLALMMVMSVSVSAAMNPDNIYGGMNYSGTSFFIGVDDNCWTIQPSASPKGAENGDGFGTENPIGYQSVSTWGQHHYDAAFGLYQFKRSDGEFSEKKLDMLKPVTEGTKKAYFTSDSEGSTEYGFIYDTTKRASTDAFQVVPGDEYNPVISFTAPMDGTFRWEVTIKREYSITSVDWDSLHPYTGDATGTYFRFYHEDTVIKRFPIQTASGRKVAVSVDMKRGESIYLEVDPWLENNKRDSVVFTNCKVYCDALYDGTMNAEYDNEGQTPLFSMALMSDTHTDEDIMLREKPVYQSVLNAFNYIKERGNIDAIVYGGDMVSDNHHHDNNPNYKYAFWTNENIDKTLDYLFKTGGAAATEGGNGLVIGVAGNHDKDPGFVASYSKNDNTYMGEENEVHSGNYYLYYNIPEGATEVNVLRFGDMANYDTNKAQVYNSLFNEVICYHYEYKGMIFMGISQSHSTAANGKQHWNTEGIWPAQIVWIEEELEKIGKDKTVILTCHYNINSVHGTTSGQGLGDPQTMLIETLEQYPNVIYTYGHVHGGNANTYTWYNTIEHAEVMGNRVQLDNGAYVTDGWHYLYMGGLWFNSYDTMPGEIYYSQDPDMAQIKIIDFYSDHFTITSVNVGNVSADPQVWDATSYTVMREMTQLEGYTGNGNGYTVPDIDPAAEGQKFVPTAVSQLKKKYTFRVAMGTMEKGNYTVGAIFTPTQGLLQLKDAVEASFDTDKLSHKYRSYELVNTSQRAGGAIFDMHAELDHSPYISFTAPEAGAYVYDADFEKLNKGSGEVVIYVTKDDGTVIQVIEPKNEANNEHIDVVGKIYLEKGEAVRIVVSKSDKTQSTSGNEVALLNMVVKAYASYEMPSYTISGDVNTGNAGNDNPATGAVSIALAIAVVTTSAVGGAAVIKRRRNK